MSNIKEILNGSGYNQTLVQRSFQEGIGYSASNRNPLDFTSPKACGEAMTWAFEAAREHVEEHGGWGCHTAEEFGQMAADRMSRNQANWETRKAFFCY